MTTRPTALVFVAVAAALAATATAPGCGGGSASEPVAAASAVDTRTGGPTAPSGDARDQDATTAGDEGGDGAAPDRDFPTHEELIEADPSTGGDQGTAQADGSTTTTDEQPNGGDDGSSTSTTTRRPVYVSQKREPTGPGVPAIPTYTQTADEVEYFACVTFRESSNNPTVINTSSGAAGLFQFLQTTWDMVARRIGRYDLVGVNPALAAVATQRYMAHVLFLWQGTSPWVSDGCQLPRHGTTTTTTTATSTTTTESTSTTSTTSPRAPAPVQG